MPTIRGPAASSAAVGPDRLAGDERAVGPGEEQGQAGDVLGLRRRRATAGTSASARARRSALRPRASGVWISPGQMALTRMRCGGQLDGRAVRQVDHRRLGRRVGQRAGAAAEPGDRRGVDDAAAAALLDHHPRRVLDAEEHAAHEDGERAVPVVDADLGERTERAADAGVVEQHVEAAEASRRRRSISASTSASSATSVRRNRSRSGSPTSSTSALAVLGVEVADDDLGALGEEAQHRRPADAAGPSGDDGDPVGEHICHGGEATRRRRPAGHRTGPGRRAPSGRPAGDVRRSAPAAVARGRHREADRRATLGERPAHGGGRSGRTTVGHRWHGARPRRADALGRDAPAVTRLLAW